MPGLNEFCFLMGTTEVKATPAHPFSICTGAPSASDPLSPAVWMNFVAPPMKTRSPGPRQDLPRGLEVNESDHSEILMMEKRENQMGQILLLLLL